MLAHAAKTENPFLVRCSETAAESLLRKLAQWCLGSFGWASVAYDWFMIALDTIDQSQLTFVYLNDHGNRYTPKHDPHFRLKLLRLTDEVRRARYISRILKLLEHFYFLHFTFFYMCVECGKDLMSYFVSCSSSSEVGNFYWRLTRPFSLLSLE